MSLHSQVLRRVLLPTHGMVRGRRYLEYLDLLSRSQWWSYEKLREFQWKELLRLLKYAFDSVPYYQRKYGKAGVRFEDIRSWLDYAQLPPLTRAEVNEFNFELCSTTFKGKLLSHSTGGSTGMPVRFYRTYESYDWRTAAKDRVYGWAGLNLGDRSVYLWGAPVGRVSAFSKLKTKCSHAIRRELVLNTFSQSEQLWAEIHARFWSYRPRIVVGYVSSLREFASFVRDRNLQMPPLQSVIAAAEPLYTSVREQIEKAFGAPVFNTYGSREFMSVSGECDRHDGMHINSENILLEAAEDGDEPSEILITDLHNYGMPFLRYTTGDLGVLEPSACSCGRGLPRLKTVQGRMLDTLRATDGRIVPGEFFPHLLKEVPEIREYQVFQKALDTIEIVAVLSRCLSAASHLLLNDEIKKVFGNETKWSITAADRISRLKSGKHRVTVGLASGAGK